MESKCTSGFLRGTAPNIGANYLASSTNILSEGLIRSLSNDLQMDKEQLARELGFQPCFGAGGLYNWCKSPGSTVFVLVSVLTNLGRTDCVQRIQQYIQMHSMQLFIKVEAAISDAQSLMTSPKFYQVTTSCEFNLIQALENILGGDLVHYEIVGPGPWVTWKTVARELKGQQLTLLYHNLPVPHTKIALYGPAEPDTELKHFVGAKNIPTSANAEEDDETHLKAFDYTQIENLKFILDSSTPVTHYSNITSHHSPEREIQDFQSVLGEGPTDINTCSLLDTHDCMFTVDSQTQAKVPIVSVNNTPEYIHVVKHFPDKFLGGEMNSLNGNDDMATEQNPLQVLNNVPRFSVLEQDLSTMSANAQIPSLQSVHNCSLQSNQKTAVQTAEKDTSQSECEKKQNNLNNLSCVTLATSFQSTFVQNSLDSQGKKPTGSDHVTRIRPDSSLSQEENADDCAMYLDDSSNQSSMLSEPGVVLFDEETSAASSLFTQGRNIQDIDVSMCSPSVDYVPHTCIQTLAAQQQNIGCVANTLLCHSSVVTPPQKRHGLGVSLSPLSPEQQIHQRHQLQQQVLLEQQALEKKQLQQQLQQRQKQQQPSPQTATSIDPNNEIFHQNHNLQQLWNHLLTVSQAGEAHQQTTYLQENFQSEQGQNSSHQNFENKSQSLHLPYFSQQFQHPLQRYQQQFSQGEIQSLDQPFLICHTPSPSFPDEETQNNIQPVSEISQRQLKQSQLLNISFNQHSNASSQSLEHVGNMIGTETRNDQYMAMFHPSAGTGITSGMTSFVRPQCAVPVDQSKSALLPNFEFTVRLPHQDSNPNNPQVILDPRNLSRVASGSSSHGTSANSGGSTPSQRRWIFNSDDQSPLMAPQPHHLISQVTDALSSHNRTPIGDSGVTSKKENLNETTITDDEGYNIIDRAHFPRSKSLPVNQWHSPATPRRAGLTLDTELQQMEGWCPHENGDTIQNTMEKYRSQDGSFIIWKSRRYNKFIISVSHLKQLFHFRVEEGKHESRDRTVYYLFEGGFRSESLLDLLNHYRQESIRISVQSTGGMKTYIEHIRLRYPIKSEVKRKDTLKPS